MSLAYDLSQHGSAVAHTLDGRTVAASMTGDRVRFTITDGPVIGPPTLTLPALVEAFISANAGVAHINAAKLRLIAAGLQYAARDRAAVLKASA